MLAVYLLIYLSNVLPAYKMYQLNIIQMYEQHTKRINQIFIECTSSVQNVFNFEQFYNWTWMVLLRVKKVRREKQALSIKAYRLSYIQYLSRYVLYIHYWDERNYCIAPFGKYLSSVRVEQMDYYYQRVSIAMGKIEVHCFKTVIPAIMYIVIEKNSRISLNTPN